jgi:hypothetical protein
MISPSPGTICPVSITTRSPIFKTVEVTSSILSPLVSRRAMVSRRVFFNESACALPRASAKAVAKFAKRTVRKSQMSSATK